MIRERFAPAGFLALAVLLLAGCGGPGDDAPSATASDDAPSAAAPDDAGGSAPAKAVPTAQPSPGKPSAPITIDYQVVGRPIVGQPLSINLEVSSSMSDRPITLNYRANDTRDLQFPPAQEERIALAAFGNAGRAAQQVTLVPQREGRLYLNVSAEVETADGTLVKSMAIPIQVGDSPAQPETNGEPKQDEDGEAVISMPAEETTP